MPHETTELTLVIPNNVNHPSSPEVQSKPPEGCWNKVVHTYKRYPICFYVIYLCIYKCLLGYACYLSWHKSTSYCEGVRLLVLLTIITYIFWIYHYLFKPVCLARLHKRIKAGDYCFSSFFQNRINQIILRCFAWILVWCGILAVIVMKALENPDQLGSRLASFFGYIGFIVIGVICSKHRKQINWIQLLWGFSIQLVFGIVVLRTKLGKAIFGCVGEKISTFLDFTKAGTEMVFGYLATRNLVGTVPGSYPVIIEDVNKTLDLPELPLQLQNSIFALTGMPVIIFFSFFVSILYFYGIMQSVVKNFGWLLQATIGTTACESISASGNIFLGMSESPLLIKPFLGQMTKSELHAVMTGGFATIAGSVMAAYISFGISASHLLSASVMAAPSALALSKLFYPETEKTQTSVSDIQLEKSSERNAIEAGSNGATSAVGLIASILANLIAFIAFLAFLDAIVGWFGAMFDLPDLSCKWILSKAFIPIAMMLGVEWTEAEQVAGLIGMKMVINEFVAYQELATLIAKNALSQRSQTIATYALCGFANLSSIGIQVGTLSTLAPSRKSDLAELAFRAMLTGSIACFMTACVAGMLL